MSFVHTPPKFVLVIGGGQAGLAAGYHLQKQNINFLIIEANTRIGDSWRQRYASLSLFTTRAFSALPGLALNHDPDGYASRDEFADYLQQYAQHFELPIRLGVSVTQLEQNASGGFSALLSDGQILLASHVIIASGGFQAPVVPALAKEFGPNVPQFTPENFGDGSALPAGPILVVGDGASGRDLAVLAAEKHPVVLATGKPRKLLPERIMGKSIWWWLSRLGLMKAPGDSMLGRLMRKKDPFPNRHRDLAALAEYQVEIMPRLVGASPNAAVFADGQKLPVAAVVWAVGYKDRTAWVHIPAALNAHQQFIHTNGVSPVNGLYFVGRPWQRNRASALVMGVGADARQVVETITAQQAQATQLSSAPYTSSAVAER